MKKKIEWCIAILMLIVFSIIIAVSIIVNSNIKKKEEYLKKKEEEYLKKCEDAKSEMIDIVEEELEALNNQDYDAFISLCSNDRKGKNPDVGSMYSFLSKDMYDFGESIDYNDFTFSLTEFDYFFIDDYFEEKGFEEALNHGIFVRVKLGNSKMQYDQTWKIVFVLEDGKIKIDQVWLCDPHTNSNATLDEVK